MHTGTIEVELVYAHFAAWERLDPQELIGYFYKDAYWDNGSLGIARGIDGIRSQIETLADMMDALQIEIHHVLCEGQVVVTERSDHVTIDNTVFDVPVVGVMEIEHNKIVAWREYFDIGHFNRA